MSSRISLKRSKSRSSKSKSSKNASHRRSPGKQKRKYGNRDRKSVNFNTFGKIKEFANEFESFIDIDSPRVPRLSGVASLSHIIGTRALWIRCDRTKHGWHIVIHWERRFLPIEHVAIQAILGSDFRRETLNLMRVLSEPRGAGRKRWNILYESKLIKP